MQISIVQAMALCRIGIIKHEILDSIMTQFTDAFGVIALHWRHNDHDSISNHQPHGCLLNRLFRPRSKKTSKLRVTGLCAGNSPGPVNSPHKGPVTRKMFPFNDVIMDMSVRASLITGNSSYLFNNLFGLASNAKLAFCEGIRRC